MHTIKENFHMVGYRRCDCSYYCCKEFSKTLMNLQIQTQQFRKKNAKQRKTSDFESTLEKNKTWVFSPAGSVRQPRNRFKKFVAVWEKSSVLWSPFLLAACKKPEFQLNEQTVLIRRA